MSLPKADAALRSISESLRLGGFSASPHHDIANEVDSARGHVIRAMTSTSRAKGQLNILADMLDDGAQPISDKRAKYIAGEIRKYLEWI